MGNEAMEAFGLSNVYCSLGLLGADVLMVGTTIPRGIPYRVTSGMVKSEGLLGQQVHLDVLAPLPSIDGLLWLGQWLVNLLGLS